MSELPPSTRSKGFRAALDAIIIGGLLTGAFLFWWERQGANFEAPLVEPALGTHIRSLSDPSSLTPLAGSAPATLGVGCELLVLVTMCPAAVDALDELGEVPSLTVRGVELPIRWVAPDGATRTMRTLRTRVPHASHTLALETWNQLAPTYVPQAVVIDEAGSLVARGWPDRDFLEALPDEFSYDFEARCGSSDTTDGKAAA